MDLHVSFINGALCKGKSTNCALICFSHLCIYICTLSLWSFVKVVAPGADPRGVPGVGTPLKKGKKEDRTKERKKEEDLI